MRCGEWLILTAFWSTLFLGMLVGFRYAGFGGSFLAAGCVWFGATCLERYWQVVGLAGLVVAAAYFWGAGL